MPTPFAGESLLLSYMGRVCSSPGGCFAVVRSLTCIGMQESVQPTAFNEATQHVAIIAIAVGHSLSRPICCKLGPQLIAGEAQNSLILLSGLVVCPVICILLSLEGFVVGVRICILLSFGYLINLTCLSTC